MELLKFEFSVILSIYIMQIDSHGEVKCMFLEDNFGAKGQDLLI